MASGNKKSIVKKTSVAKKTERAGTLIIIGSNKDKTGKMGILREVVQHRGRTPAFDRIVEIFKNGGVIVGTSAGAAAMGKNMLVGGENSESHKVGNWMMAPGLGLVEDITVNQHFSQRGRIGRLLGAVALNPGILGIDIDKDTAIVMKGDDFNVIGSSSVNVVDGRFVSSTNISEAAAEKTMSMHGVRLHILAHDEKFNLVSRQPSR